jgi:cysteine protease ATG4
MYLCSLQLGRNHKPIFTIQDEPPTWPSDTDEFMGLESISEPDDMDMDDNDNDDDEEAQDDGADEPFFDTRDGTRSSSTSPDASVRGGARSSDFDTEEDPMGPDTPGQTPRTTFEVGKGGLPEEAFDDKHRKEDVDVAGDQDDDDDDDDWVDPSVPTSPLPPPKIQAPAMVQTHSNSSSSSSSSGVKVKSSKSKKTAKRKSASVVPVLRAPPEPHFPFPSSVEDTTTPQQEDFQHQRDQLPEMQPQQQGNGKKLQRMHTARARDGGRTQSGGVKGVLTTEDGGENF